MTGTENDQTLTSSGTVSTEPNLKASGGSEWTIGSKTKTLVIILGLLFWLYVSLNTFIVSIDSYYLSSLPRYLQWAIIYKSIIIVVCAAITIAVMGTKRFILCVLGILLMPLIIFGIGVWKFGKHVLKSKSWFLIIVAMETITATFSNFKIKFISFAIFTTSAVIVLANDNEQLLILASASVAIVLIASYIQSFMSAISPPNTFKLMHKAFDKESDKIEDVRFKSFRLEEAIRDKPLALLSASELDKWNNVLQNSIIYNRAMLFYARAMRDYQRSNLLFLPGVFTVLRLTTFTVLSFSLINLALFSIEPSNFSVNKNYETGFFKFFYYSFNSLVLNGIDDVKPVSAFAQSVLMAQELLSFILALILVSLFISYRTQRASSDIDKAIEIAKREAASIESLLQTEFKIASIARAIDHLKQAEGNLLKFIHWLSRGI